MGRSYRSLIAAALTTSVVGTGALAAPALAATPPDGSANYNIQTFNNNNDPTFNQLLGINDHGLIAGYFGSGEAGHPNKGYLLHQPYGSQGSYINENFPGSAQTQVTGLNNHGVQVGFWVDKPGNQFSWYAMHGRHFKMADFPTRQPAKPRVDQLLGVNDNNVAVGFYNDANNNAHGYTYSINDHRFKTVNVAGASAVTATAINNAGDVAGFETDGAGNTVSFLNQAGGRTITLSVPGADSTQALGVNNGDEVVGFYTVGSGPNAQTFGFAWSPGFGFQTINDPKGVGATTINGVNDRGQLVGFYTDANMNTDGLVATPEMMP